MAPLHLLLIAASTMEFLFVELIGLCPPGVPLYKTLIVPTGSRERLTTPTSRKWYRLSSRYKWLGGYVGVLPLSPYGTLSRSVHTTRNGRKYSEVLAWL